MEYKTPEEQRANTASILDWQRHLADKALKTKMHVARCPSTHCERRGECTSPSECSVRFS